ncbi:YbjQ family protein [Acidimangrovimonas sediminis]|uniref:YbjQ family protein n=1 Tax=Acidimangrovimonas sediminis TaxID=2056283 RepID=UPI000C7FAEAB|nr:YbjQ family protein [Acidimangrovimonas sediminis]
MVLTLDLHEGLCEHCLLDYKRDAAEARAQGAARRADIAQTISNMLVTTETHLSEPIAERIEVISAEAVLGMNIFRDIGAAWRDVVGGRNKSMQDELRAARKSVLNELKREAAELGANAVIAVDLDYSEISGGGKSMMLLVASGTAVKLGV